MHSLKVAEHAVGQLSQPLLGESEQIVACGIIAGFQPIDALLHANDVFVAHGFHVGHTRGYVWFMPQNPGPSGQLQKSSKKCDP